MKLTLHDTLNDLEEKAKKAKLAADIDIHRSLNQSDIRKRLDFSSYLNTCCDFDLILELITALRDAEETLKQIEDPALPGRPSYADWELRQQARWWLAKYAKGKS